MRFLQAMGLCLLGLAAIARGATGEELTVKDQHLLACPNSPNCVSTMATEESQAIAPYRFQKPLYEAKAVLIQIFSEFPRTELVKEWSMIIVCGATIGLVVLAMFATPVGSKK